jgi:phospholipid-binding lipoprotein MlaA
MRPRRPRLLLLLAAASVLAAGHAAAARDPTDPFEPMNRRFYEIQDSLDQRFIAPLAHGFGKTPFPLRAGLVNFGHNLGEPTIFVNDILQARFPQAAKTLTRFVVNSTIGIGGLFDVAGHNHLKRHDNGFGTTLGRWGAKPGPYLFFPLVGPTTFRDVIGDLVDIPLNPMSYARYAHKAAIGIGTSVINGLGQRVESDQDLETIRQTSTDPYASLRSFYMQNREKEVSGKEVTIENLPEFDEPAKPGAAPAPTSPPSPKPQATPPEAPKGGPSASACAPAAERWADADAPYATWRGD